MKLKFLYYFFIFFTFLSQPHVKQKWPLYHKYEEERKNMVGEGEGEVARILTNTEVLQNPILHMLFTVPITRVRVSGVKSGASLYISLSLPPTLSSPLPPIISSVASLGN